MLKALSILGLMIAWMAMADDTSSGCGLGWKVSSRMSLSSSSTRSTTNGTFSNQTFGMTSGTSGCDRHSIVKKEKKSLHYAEANFDNLMIEMSQGQGEYLNAFASVLGCDPEAFSSVTQQRFGEIFSQETTNAPRLLKNVTSVIQSNPTLAASCAPSA